MISISVINQKGGVGKTTTVLNLAAAFADVGKRVLMIDNDPQGNLSSYSSTEFSDNQLYIDEVYLSRKVKHLSLEELHMVKEKLYLLPADPHLSGVEYFLMSQDAKEFKLSNSLKELKPNFDVLLVDNPPSLNILSINGIVASEYVLFPVLPDYFSLEGLSLILRSFQDLKKWNANLKILGMFTNMFDARKKLNREVRQILEEQFGDLLFTSKIRNSIKLPESASHALSIFDYAPKSKVSEDFKSFADEVLTRCLGIN